MSREEFFNATTTKKRNSICNNNNNTVILSQSSSRSSMTSSLITTSSSLDYDEKIHKLRPVVVVMKLSPQEFQRYDSYKVGLNRGKVIPNTPPAEFLLSDTSNNSDEQWYFKVIYSIRCQFFILSYKMTIH